MADDEEDEDRPIFKTPLLTPRVSEARTTQYEQHMDEFNRNLQQRLRNNYSSNNNNNDDYESESESESEVQDQQPTEATDDSVLPIQLQVDPVETSFPASLYPQPSRDRDDICSPEQEIEVSDENFSGVVPDMDSIYETKPVDSPNMVYSESLCVPYTDEVDEISILKQTTTITTTEYTEIKKDKNSFGHIMISYNHSTKALCTRIAKALRSLNYPVWIDQDNISGDVFTSMASAVENAFIVLMAINEQYSQSRYCRLEAEYAVERNKASVPMLMQEGYKAIGWLGLINGSKLHIDFSRFQFDEAFNLLLREIEAVRISLGVEIYDRATTTITTNCQSMTTMDCSWNNYQNAKEWNGDDVMDWLHREKLEAFENVLTGFTGATLYQLYKIKLDSPSDFYRTIEQLILPTVPFRLFYNLTFIAALEKLFS